MFKEEGKGGQNIYACFKSAFVQAGEQDRVTPAICISIARFLLEVFLFF